MTYFQIKVVLIMLVVVGYGALTGDQRNNYGHNIVVGQKLLMVVTSLMWCKPKDTDAIVDPHGRARLPRPKPWQMMVFLRGVPELIKHTQQYMHWRDLEEAYLKLDPRERAEYIFLCVDNGSGFDPTDDVGAYY